MLTFAVLLNYNDGNNIIRSVKKLATFKSVNKIILVDNGSTDTSLATIKNLKLHKLIIVKNKKNFGFARGCNIGFKLALKMGAQNIVNLNPDLDYSTDFIKELNQNKADIIMPILKTKIGKKTVYDYGGKINWVLGRAYHLQSLKTNNPFTSISCDYLSGGAILIRKNVFEKIGFFDERFFIYYEDADYSLRAKQAGLKLFLDTKVVIEHKLEIVKNTGNIQKMKYNLASNFYFVVKWVPWYFKPLAFLYLLWLWSKIYV